MSKHTPGPWHWVSAYAGKEDEYGCATPGPIDVSTFKSSGYSGNPELVGADGETVVSGGCGEYVPYYGKTNEQKVANARLIAAAPDLLEALKAAVECGMVPKSSAADGGANRHIKQLHVADQIRTAIAKATVE